MSFGTFWRYGKEAADDGVYSVALSVQIYLQTNRVDLAIKEVAAAKRWAQDSLLVNIAESWVGLRVVRLLISSGVKHSIPYESLILTYVDRAAKNTNPHSTSTKN